MPFLHMLDTDIVSYIIRKRPPGIETRLAGLPLSHVCMSAVTRAELMYGLKRLPRSHWLHMGVREFLRVVRPLAWDADAADQYADIRHQLTQQGQPIGELDLMIAAHALAANAVLVTNNGRHYRRIDAPLQVVNWAEPSSRT